MLYDLWNVETLSLFGCRKNLPAHITGSIINQLLVFKVYTLVHKDEEVPSSDSSGGSRSSTQESLQMSRKMK